MIVVRVVEVVGVTEGEEDLGGGKEGDVVDLSSLDS